MWKICEGIRPRPGLQATTSLPTSSQSHPQCWFFWQQVGKGGMCEHTAVLPLGATCPGPHSPSSLWSSCPRTGGARKRIRRRSSTGSRFMATTAAVAALAGILVLARAEGGAQTHWHTAEPTLPATGCLIGLGQAHEFTHIWLLQTHTITSHTQTHLHTHTYTHTRTRTHTYTHTNIHTHTRTHTHTHIQRYTHLYNRTTVSQAELCSCPNPSVLGCKN